MRLLGLVLVMLCVLTATAVAADEPAKPPAAKPATATMEATLGEYANGLWAQRNALEQQLAEAKATVKALQKQVEELSKKSEKPAP